MDRLILNCDLGESEPFELTEEIMSLVDAANICCGVHDGDLRKTRAAVELAHQRNVMIGAHPGLASDGGRGEARLTADEFHELLRDQFGHFTDIASAVGAHVSYIKLHGSLYHAVERDSKLRKVYLDFVTGQGGDIAIFCLAGGVTAKDAEALRIRVYHEAFADRAYLADGSLMPRSEEGAVLTEKQAVERFETWRLQGYMRGAHDEKLSLHADTLCVHGDSKGSLGMIKAIRERLT